MISRFWVPKIKLYLLAKIITIKITDMKYPINKVLTPSIKFDPLIKISRQKMTKKYLNKVYESNWSNKGILIEDIKVLLKKTKINITVICKKNLLWGDFTLFKSDKIPTKKIKNII